MNLLNVGLVTTSSGIITLSYLWLFYVPPSGAGVMNGIIGAFIMLIAMGLIGIGLILIIISLFTGSNNKK